VISHLAAAGGALMSRLAPARLGPPPAERDRLARELHDSVGHALSVMAIQASAAERVLERDPAVARRALAEIGASAREGMRDLDHVLGLLREEPAATAAPPSLDDLGRLLAASLATGVRVNAQVSGGLAVVPPAVSREAYRILQEGLTNAARHAGGMPTRVRVAVAGERLEVELVNPLPATAGRPAARGGRGLTGIRERVAALGGRVSAGPDGGHWRVTVELPLR
jgi:signal transduction histidine kinase